MTLYSMPLNFIVDNIEYVAIPVECKYTHINELGVSYPIPTVLKTKEVVKWRNKCCVWVRGEKPNGYDLYDFSARIYLSRNSPEPYYPISHLSKEPDKESVDGK